MFETLLFALALNFAGLTAAFYLKTDKLTDISYSLTFIGIALFGILRNDMNLVKWLAVGVVFIWASRLGSYLLYRIYVMGRDKRFDDRRNNFVEFGKFWMLQAVTAWIVMLPISYLLKIEYSLEITSSLAFGLALAIFGIVFEGIADLQKFNFIQNKNNKGKWIETGLWKYSRHPNYFGEIITWIGVYFACVIYLETAQVWAAVSSPLLIAGLLLFVSGIPLLEKSADKKWSRDKNYQKYKSQTSILIPTIRSK